MFVLKLRCRSPTVVGYLRQAETTTIDIGRSMKIAKDVLLEFFRKMHRWEVNGLKLVNEKGMEPVRDELREQLIKIYDEFLAKPGGKFGRLAGPNVGYPPEYDEQHEDILSIDDTNPKKVIVATLWRHPTVPDFTREQKYTLFRKNDEWRIVKKEAFRPTANKWENSVF
ncbi:MULTISPECIES: NTF2 fold immunity protein [unclassified Dyella]|uniref:NTF2 fold immunity protein n=1 Tax=unclassified Dyella TaxID=2634549 RepID=UPI002032CCB2|nr:MULTISPECIES: NTF2 fold immunity protein [unclassified Dyella]